MNKDNYQQHFGSGNESIKFIPAQIFYQVVQTLELDFSNYCVTHNFDGMMMSYRFLCSKVYPYLSNYATDEEKEILDISDIYKKKSELKPGDSDFDVKFNSQIIMELEQKIMQKLDILNELRKRASFDVVVEKKSWKPSALASDDF